MSVWFKKVSLTEQKVINEVKLLALLGFELTEIGTDYLCGQIPVDDRTKQPFGILHGGSSVILAETLGSIGSNLIINSSTHYAVGIEVNCNHLRMVDSGFIIATATPLHIGSITHVWNIRLCDKEGQLSAICRLTVAVLMKSKA